MARRAGLRAPGLQRPPALVSTFHALLNVCPCPCTCPCTTCPCSFLIGFWPAYGLLTPLILGLIMLGSLLVFHFIPFC